MFFIFHQKSKKHSRIFSFYIETLRIKAKIAEKFSAFIETKNLRKRMTQT